MPLESVIVLTAIATAFTVFAAVLAWAEFQTRRPKEGARHIRRPEAGPECSRANGETMPIAVASPVAVAPRYTLQGLVNTWTSWRQRRLAIVEVDALDPVEKRRLAQDLGIPTTELEVLASRDSHSADLLLRRLAALSLDPSRIDRAFMRDMQRCCSTCNSKSLCEHELESRSTQARWPEYCPNEQTIASLRAKAPSKHDAAA
jgi:hypothetical protein